MQCGVSTSCFYPMETIEALETLQKAGVTCGEIFLNTFSELEEPYVSRLVETVRHGSMRIEALHPFSSGMETFFFASAYDARVEDGIALYRKYFLLAQKIEAPRLVFHGDYCKTPFPFERHCRNFARLRDVGREYGVELCQENVVRSKCGTPDYIRKMRAFLKDDVNFVLDIKQLRRAGVPLNDMLDAMRGHLTHLHLSDETPICDCALPGEGTFDFASLFRALRADHFDGSMLVELYRGDFKDVNSLLRAADYLDSVYAATETVNPM